jgi:hypothetical protein
LCAVTKQSGWHASGSEKPEDDSTGLENSHRALILARLRTAEKATAGLPHSEGCLRGRARPRKGMSSIDR